MVDDAQAVEAEPGSEQVASGEPARAQLEAYFGASFEKVSAFHAMLAEHGEERGLIGPRELGRLWNRHILNSAAVVRYLPARGTIVDVGSGAGLPGIVIAAMLPDAEVVLIEPMERRCAWLDEVVETVGLPNVTVRRGRADEYAGAIEADAVTSRAVASLSKLVRWSFPLVAVGGELVVLKGRNVRDEIEPARKALRSFGASEPEIVEATTIDGTESTTVLRSRRGR